MAKPTNKFSKDEVLHAFIKENGYTHMVAIELGCSERAVMKYIKDYKLSAMLKDFRDHRHARMVVKAESGLEKAVTAQKPWAITFALSRLDREHYSEKQIIEQTGLEVIKPKKKKCKK